MYHRIRDRHLFPLWAAVLTITALAVHFASPATAAGPSLRVSATPATVAPGGSVQVEYSVGKPPATLVLSLDRGSRQTVRVRKRRGRTTYTVPAGTSPGAHRLSVCLKRACRSLALRVSARRPAAGGPGSSSSATGAAAPQAPAPTPQTPPASDIDFSGPADPLDVDARTDTARRAAATIGTAGGTLETTGADGTHYRLVVPEGALLSPERISMTPIAAVDGLPFSGGLVAGVQLEPSGLRFSDYVTVEVTGHPPVAPDRETGFLYQHDGAEFQLTPIEEGPSKTTFRIIHFSGVGIASGTEAERNAQLLRRTRDVEGRFAQQLATYFRPGEPVDMDGVKATLRAYHDQVLKPLLQAAVTDDGLAVQAINRYIPWARMIALLIGDEDDFMLAERQTRHEEWLEVFENAAVKAHKRCVEENRPQEMVAILSWWHQLGLLGLEDRLPADTLTSCVRFELDFHTKIAQEFDANVEGPEVWKAEAIAENVILEPQTHQLEVSGQTDAQYVDFRVEIPPHQGGTGCWHFGGEWESTFPFTVSRVKIDLNPVQHTDGTYGYTELDLGRIAVSIVPFSVREFHGPVDCGGGSGPGNWGMFLAPTFMELHEDLLDDESGLVVTDWTVPAGGGSMLGSKAYFRTVMLSGLKTREETTLELYHAPLTGG